MPGKDTQAQGSGWTASAPGTCSQGGSCLHLLRRARLLCRPRGRAEQQQRGPDESPGGQQRGLFGEQRGTAAPVSCCPFSLPTCGWWAMADSSSGRSTPGNQYSTGLAVLRHTRSGHPPEYPWLGPQECRGIHPGSPWGRCGVSQRGLTFTSTDRGL